MFYDKPITEFQRHCRRSVPLEETTLIYDHVARRVRQDDMEAFRLMNSETKYSDLPESLTRYDTTKYVDKYKRHNWDKVGRTITAHMAKDGYWYIHPEQNRTFTIREAARLQTFPDHFRFSGYPTNVYRQIGEAVPPVFGKALGECIYEVLKHPDTGRIPVSTQELSEAISAWLRDMDPSDFVSPWRQISLSSVANPLKIWQASMGMILLGKISSTARRQNLWPVLMEEFSTPDHYLESPSREHVVKICGRGRLFPELDALAVSLSSKGVESEVDYRDKIPVRYLREVEGICPASAGISAPIVTAATVRTAKRIFQSEDDVDAPGSKTLLISLVLGDSDDGTTGAGLLEIGERFCKPGVPDCEPCPLNGICLTGKDMVSLDGQVRLV